MPISGNRVDRAIEAALGRRRLRVLAPVDRTPCLAAPTLLLWKLS
jgi:hypothetical protein